MYMAIETGPKLVPKRIWPVGENLKVQEIYQDFAHFYTNKYRESAFVSFYIKYDRGLCFLVVIFKYSRDSSKKKKAHANATKIAKIANCKDC